LINYCMHERVCNVILLKLEVAICSDRY
jgi:hypothetical protein